LAIDGLKKMDNSIPFLILDSWNKPVVFVDTNHQIQYMNKPARRHYSKWGDVVGKSIFDCHNDNSRETIEKAFRKLVDGVKEVMIVNSKKHRVFMRSVRNEKGTMVGYYERYDSPILEQKDESLSNKSL
jgi:DUF438 domain-containing protein